MRKNFFLALAISIGGAPFIQNIAQSAYGNPDTDTLCSELGVFHRVLVMILKNFDENSLDSFRFDVSNDLINYFNNPESLTQSTPELTELKEVLKNTDPRRLFNVLFNLGKNSSGYVLKILDSQKQGALGEAFLGVSKNFSLSVDALSLRDFIFLGRALVVLNYAFNQNIPVDKKLLCNALNKLNEKVAFDEYKCCVQIDDTPPALNNILAALSKSQELEGPLNFFHAVSALEHIRSSENSFQHSGDFYNLKNNKAFLNAFHFALNQLPFSSLKLLLANFVHLNHGTPEDLVRIFSALSSIDLWDNVWSAQTDVSLDALALYTWDGVQFSKLVEQNGELHHLPAYVQVLDFSLNGAYRNFINPKVFAHILNHTARRINKGVYKKDIYQDIFFKFLNNLSNDLFNFCYAFNTLFNKSGAFTETLVCLSDGNKQDIFEQALRVFTSSPKNLVKELDYVLNSNRDKEINKFVLMLNSNPKMMSSILSAFGEDINWGDLRFILYRIIENFIENIDPNIFSSSFSILLSEKYSNACDFFSDYLNETVPEQLNRIFKNFFCTNPQAANKFLSRALEKLLDSFEDFTAEDQYKALKTTLESKIKRVELFYKKKRINLYIGDEERLISFDNSAKILKFIASAIKFLPKNQRVRLLELALSKNFDIRLCARYLDLTDTSFEMLSKSWQEEIIFNFSKIFENEDIYSFWRFKKLIDQEKFEDKLFDYSDGYKKFAQLADCFYHLRKDHPSEDREKALDFLDKNFQTDEDIDRLLRWFDDFYPDDCIEYLENLKDLKLKNLKKKIEESYKAKRLRLAEKIEEFNKFFRDEKITDREIDYAREVMKYLDEVFKMVENSPSAAVEELVSPLFDSNEALRLPFDPDEIIDKVLKSEDQFNDNEELHERIKEFYLFYKDFVNQLTQRELVTEFFDISEKIFYFIEKTGNFSDTTDSKFLEYLALHSDEDSFQVIEMGMKFVSQNLEETEYKTLMGSFNHAVQTEIVEKTLIHKKNRKFISDEMTKILENICSQDVEDRLIIENTVRVDKKVQYFQEFPLSFFEENMREFSKKYRENSRENRKFILDEFVNFCLRTLDNENPPCGEYFNDEGSCNIFVKKLKDISQKYIAFYKESDDYERDLFERHPYSVLGNFFQDSVTQENFFGGEKCKAELLTDALLSFLNIRGYPLLEYDQ
ncbi:hypothetical protein K737_300133 [Holospora undulata HU1]|uniref:Uncharacterized protein n=2 Tax=Holospora TaxID=44747 RepID=A0A061JIK6_9PROT|nr:hypothetical protein K737_300133 [Holospora undulata HU1]